MKKGGWLYISVSDATPLISKSGCIQKAI